MAAVKTEQAISLHREVTTTTTKQQWMEHVYRMDHQRLVKGAVDFKSVGRRPVGTLWKRWLQ